MNESSIKKSSELTKRIVKAMTFEVQDRPADKELPEDPFRSMISDGILISPPFDMMALSLLKEQNSELGQCIEAMVTNVDGFGYRFVPRVKKLTLLSKEQLEEMRCERVYLENFFAYVAGFESFTNMRSKMREDQEETGNSWVEILRNNGTIAGFNHIPAYQMRLSVKEKEPTLVELPVFEMQEDGTLEIVNRRMFYNFRLHVQAISGGATNVNGVTWRWFKSFGDPKHYNNETGKQLTDEEAAKLPESKLANEVLHGMIYAQRTPYGIPRYIGNLLSILGDRASEEVNYKTLKSNNIPSLAIMVSNGQLTQGTIDRINSFVESQISGSDNYSKFLLMEAETDSMTGEDAGTVKIEIKPLTKDQHTDELFQNYSKNNQKKIRRAFRLPPVLIGDATEYSRSIADTSRRVADEQVFAPLRDEFDSVINRLIFPDMGIKYHQFKSNTPNVTDTTEIIRALGMTEKTGALTPRIARDVLEVVFSKDLPEFSKEFDADVPFSMTMAEAVKNKADPTEPGQQVTALKTKGGVK